MSTFIQACKYFITEQFHGLESLLIVGDSFVRRSAKQVFLRASEQQCLTTEWFEVKIQTADYNTSNPFIVSRICNAITTGLNKSRNMPKMIAIILENDMILDLDNEKNWNKYAKYAKHEFYGRYLDTIVQHFP